MTETLSGSETAARGRRIHTDTGSPSAGGHGLTGYSAFCLHTTNHKTRLITSPSSLQEMSPQGRASRDEKLKPFAREAEERLDQRLSSTSRKSRTIRRNNSDLSEESLRSMNGKTVMITELQLQTEVFGSKRVGDGGGGGGSKRFSWAKFGWKTWEQEECSVCLEKFRVGENLVNLACAHKFHSRCLVPWLDNNSHCPCCRKIIFAEN